MQTGMVVIIYKDQIMLTNEFSNYFCIIIINTAVYHTLSDGS